MNAKSKLSEREVDYIQYFVGDSTTAQSRQWLNAEKLSAREEQFVDRIDAVYRLASLGYLSVPGLITSSHGRTRLRSGLTFLLLDRLSLEALVLARKDLTGPAFTELLRLALASTGVGAKTLSQLRSTVTYVLDNFEYMEQ